MSAGLLVSISRSAPVQSSAAGANTMGRYLAAASLWLSAGLLSAPATVLADGELRIAGVANPVTVHLTVTAADGTTPITDLQSGAFQIIEDGASQSVSSVTYSATTDMAVAFVMDYSGSMRKSGALDDMEAAVTQFLDHLGAGDKAGVIKFNNLIGVREMQPLTSDKALLETAIATDPGEGARTNLWDAVAAGVEMLNQSGFPEHARALIVLSDGRDNESDIALADLAIQLDNSNTPVFVVALGEDVDAANLEAIAHATGGAYAAVTDAARLDEIYSEFGTRLNSEYVLEYNSAATGCGDHTVQVLVSMADGSTATYDGHFSRCFPELVEPETESPAQPADVGGALGSTDGVLILMLGLPLVIGRLRRQ